MGFQRRQLLRLCTDIRCPECGVAMVERTSIRDGEAGKFYGCSRFPLCIGTRPQGGDGVDSYTKLLRKSYMKATLFLSSPKFMGYTQAPIWLLTKAIGREPTEEEIEELDINSMANEHLEQGIDAACAWVSERAEAPVDFLVLAHEERYESRHARLKYVTSNEKIRSMPKAEIIRRYDTSDLTQFEAELGSGADDGIYCPRCGGWSESKEGDNIEPALMKSPDQMTNAEIEDLFFSDKPVVVKLNWECGNCGPFTRIITKQGKETDEQTEFENDLKNPTYVKGITFKPAPSKSRK